MCYIATQTCSSHSTIVPQLCRAIVHVAWELHSIVAPQHHSTVVPQACSTIVLQYHSAVAPQHHSTIAPQHCSSIGLQYHSTIDLQYHSTIDLQYHSTVAPQHHSTIAPQHCSSIIRKTETSILHNIAQYCKIGRLEHTPLYCNVSKLVKLTISQIAIFVCLSNSRIVSEQCNSWIAGLQKSTIVGQ